MSTKAFLNAQKTTWPEKILYGLGGVGGNLCWTFIIMFITVYYTNSVGIAAGVVGTFMLTARILDGISDIIFSAMMQKINFKMGKVRPWFLICAPILGVSILLCFNVPSGLSMGAKGIYAFVTYTFTAAISYTIFNLAFASFLPLISYDEQDRNLTSTIGNVIIFAGISCISMFTPILLALGGGESNQSGWRMTSIIYAILCMLFVADMALIKEKEPPIDSANRVAESTTEEKNNVLGFKDALKYVLTTKYTWILLIFFFLFTFISGVSAIIYYDFMYVIKNTAYYGISTTIGLIATIVGLFVVPKIFEKLGKQKTVIAAMLIFTISSFAIYINPRSVGLITGISVIKCFCNAPVTVLQFVFVADLTDYLFKKYDVQIGHVVAMTSSVGMKVGTGLGSAVVGWGLALIGFNAAEAVQSAFTENGIVFMVAVVPAACSFIMAILMGMWDLEKKKTEI